MRGLNDETAMFETHEHDGEKHEHFDKGYAESDGTTPVEDLFVASPYGETGYQASMAAGRGTRVGITVVEDVRREAGYPDAVANYYDWMRREAELDGEWRDRDRWRTYFDDRVPRITTSRRIVSPRYASRKSTAGSRRISPMTTSNGGSNADTNDCSSTSTTT